MSPRFNVAVSAMIEERRIVDATLVRPSKWQIAASALLPLAVSAVVAMNAPAPESYLFTALTLLAGVWFTLHARSSPRVEAAVGELVVDATGLRIGATFIPRSGIRRARIVVAGGLRSMVLLDRGRFRSTVGLRMLDSEAYALVHALQLDATRVRDRFRTNGPGSEVASRWLMLALVVAVVPMLIASNRARELVAILCVIAAFELATRAATKGDLRALSSPETFRSLGFAAADMKRILGDGRVAAATRARAAIALGDRAETRRIALQTTHPRLRVALERAARDEEIDDLLDELDAELTKS